MSDRSNSLPLNQTNEQRGPRAQVGVFLILIAGVLLLATTVELYFDYVNTWKRQSLLMRDVAKVVEGHSYLFIKSIDVELQRAADLARENGSLDPFKAVAMGGPRSAIRAGFVGNQSIFIFDSAGDVVAETAKSSPRQFNVADRGYFQAAQAGRAFDISPAVISRASGDAVLTVSRRLQDADNRFLGVAAVGFPASQLADFYNLLDFELNPLIGIYRDDGAVLVRRMDAQRWVGASIANGPLFQVELKKAPAGQFISTSPLDGVRRLAAYETMREYGLIILAGVAQDVAMESWRHRTAFNLCIVTAAGAVILIATFWGWRWVDRHQRSQFLLLEAVARGSESERRLADARMDQLTGIAGRALFLEQAQRAFSRAMKAELGVGMLYVDLDGFKNVNDRLGHKAGDDVLQAAAKAILECLRERDIAGRLGGDEFAACLVASNERLTEMLPQVAQRIISRIGSIGNEVGCSIGIARSAPESTDVAELLECADDAMYAAKKSGKNRYEMAEG